MRARHITAVAALVWALGACDTAEVTDPQTEHGSSATNVMLLDAEHAEAYLRKLAPMLVGRVLTKEERAQIRASGGGAIRPILEAWATEPGLSDAARTMMELKLSVSGQRDDIDFNLPGNTVAHVVKNGRPWSEILTSETCYTKDDVAQPCDTGAPYAAGVLGTRAFMASRAGRFNLTRAGTVMGVFACSRYPLPDTLEPRIDKMRLLEMFRAANGDEQTVDVAKGGFGNGLKCYTCHGQFSLHAQLFVRFDKTGLWHADATGLQNPDVAAQLGESTGGTFTSHLINPTEASSEVSQMFGQPVQNLAEAARVVGESAVFQQCSVQNILSYALPVDRSVPVAEALMKDIAGRVVAAHPDPTFQDIVIETFSDPQVAYTASKALVQSDVPPVDEVTP